MRFVPVAGESGLQIGWLIGTALLASFEASVNMKMLLVDSASKA
jgi:hypothetical protein